MIDIAITRKRAVVAAGTTAFHIVAWATFATYLDVMNGRVEDFCLVGNSIGSWATLQECVFSRPSLEGSWFRSAFAFTMGYGLALAVMLAVWIAASVVLFRRRAQAPGARPSTAPARIPYSMSYDSAAVVLIWSLVQAAAVGAFTLASLLLFVVLALLLAVGRGLLAAISPARRDA